MDNVMFEHYTTRGCIHWSHDLAQTPADYNKKTSRNILAVVESVQKQLMQQQAEQTTVTVNCVCVLVTKVKLMNYLFVDLPSGNRNHRKRPVYCKI